MNKNKTLMPLPTEFPVRVQVRCGVSGRYTDIANLFEIDSANEKATIRWESRREMEEVPLDNVIFEGTLKRTRRQTAGLARTYEKKQKRTEKATSTTREKPTARRKATAKREEKNTTLTKKPNTLKVFVKKDPMNVGRLEQRQAQSKQSSSVINLLSDSDSNHDDDDPEIINGNDIKSNIVSPTVSPTVSTKMEGNDEVAFVGSTGPNPLSDFPHSRENCVTYPFQYHSSIKDKMMHCANCYCYVCDDKVSNCQQWESHCCAMHKSPYWNSMRARHKKNKNIENTCGQIQQTVSSTSSSRSSSSSVFSNHAQSTLDRFFSNPQRQTVVARPRQRVSDPLSQRPTTTRTINAAVRQHAVIERGIPDGDGEENSTEQLSITHANEANNSTKNYEYDDNNKSYSIESLLNQITQVHPVEVVPPYPLFKTTLRHYQRQSLAFMQDLEKDTTENENVDITLHGIDTRGKYIKSGWLSSDVGMGKSAIVIALVATDQVQFRSHPQFISYNSIIRHYYTYRSMMKVNVTVVLTSASLMGQWEDECKKHAPGLRVRRYHPSSRSRVSIDLGNMKDVSQLSSVDILISTATFAWPDSITKFVEFHRVVMDEAHLLSNSVAANITFAMKICATRKWCVTATPFTTGVGDLTKQVQFLYLDKNPVLRQNISSSCSTLYDAIQTCNSNNHDSKSFQIIANELQKRMTRHQKSQSISGSQALSLPNLTIKTIFLQMSSVEKANYEKKYNNSVCSYVRQQKHNTLKNFSSFTLQQNILHPLSSDVTFDNWTESTKIKALLEDVKQLEGKNPNLRIVVFTQYRHTHAEVSKALKKFFVIPVVYEITGSTSTTDRDFAIRCFQGSGGCKDFPSALVVTLKAGSVGMTLTAASCLYLMDPSIDLAAEKQAMGRIHRLGQDQPTTVKKFVFRDSVEENIGIFHDAIKNASLKLSNNRIPMKGFEMLTRGMS